MSTGSGQAVGLGVRVAGQDQELGDGREYMTADELAGRWSVTLAWLYNETRAGRVPHLKLRRYVRYRRSTIEAWERENEAGSVACAGGGGHHGARSGAVGRRV